MRKQIVFVIFALMAVMFSGFAHAQDGIALPDREPIDFVPDYQEPPGYTGSDIYGRTVHVPGGYSAGSPGYSASKYYIYAGYYGPGYNPYPYPAYYRSYVGYYPYSYYYYSAYPYYSAYTYYFSISYPVVAYDPCASYAFYIGCGSGPSAGGSISLFARASTLDAPATSRGLVSAPAGGTINPVPAPRDSGPKARWY